MQITVKKKESFSSWQPSPWDFLVEPGLCRELRRQ